VITYIKEKKICIKRKITREKMG